MNRVYGYCRISTAKQNIERQIRNILAEFPNADIRTEVYTGTKTDGREEFNKIIRNIKEGDTIIFDSVSRMSRNADDGIALYMKLFDRGVNLVFLKERYIDTSVYQENIKDRIALTGTDEDEIFKGINNYFRRLAERQIRIAFDQAQKEVDDLHQRTKEGLETARRSGKTLGQTPGAKLNVKKVKPIKSIIEAKSRDFNGSNTDEEVMAIIRGTEVVLNEKKGKQKLIISRKTYYKYKKEIRESKRSEIATEQLS